MSGPKSVAHHQEIPHSICLDARHFLGGAPALSVERRWFPFLVTALIMIYPDVGREEEAQTLALGTGLSLMD